MLIAAAEGCPKPDFTNQLAHAGIGGAIALSVFMICVTAIIIAMVRD